MINSSSTGDPAEHYGVNTLRPLTRTSSRESIQWARQRIEHCTNNHDCGRILNTSPDTTQQLIHPIRLVDVRMIDRSQVRLVSIEAASQYATLSYCWGTNPDPPWVTTTSNMVSRHVGFSTHILPQTLRDAITLTRELGYDYLWIDALCILQGDDSIDWEQQTSQMGLIYGNSCITIAPSAPMSAESGIFNVESVDQSHEIPAVIDITTRTADGQESTLHVFEWTGHTTREEEESPKELREDALSQRGWVYQERLFSPRTLHYTSNQLFWECRKHYLAEDGLYTQPFTEGSAEGYPVAGRLRQLAKRGPGQLTFNTTWKWYTSIVPDYTRRHLSRPADKLPALSAVAKLIHDYTGAKYHAGLWLDAIQFGLCWSVTGPATRPAECRSPSYSWAAVDGVIQWSFPIFDNPPPADFVVVAQHISSQSRDPFGAVDSGRLQLYGQLKPAVIRAVVGDESDPLNYSNGELWETNDAVDRMWRLGGMYPPKVILDEPEIGSYIEVQCFLLCSTQPELPGDRYWESYMLLLRPADKTKNFRRVGIAVLSEDNRAHWIGSSSRQQINLV